MSTDDAERMELEAGQVLRIPDWFDPVRGREPSNHGRPLKGPADWRIERVHSGNWRRAFRQRHGEDAAARAITLLDEVYQLTTRLPIELRGLVCTARAQPFTCAQLAVSMCFSECWVSAGIKQLVDDGALEVVQMSKQLINGNRRKKQCEKAWKRGTGGSDLAADERRTIGAQSAHNGRRERRLSLSLSSSLIRIPHPPTPAPEGGGELAGSGQRPGEEGTQARRHAGTQEETAGTEARRYAGAEEETAGTESRALPAIACVPSPLRACVPAQRPESRRARQRRIEQAEIAAANARVLAARQETAAQQRMVGP